MSVELCFVGKRYLTYILAYCLALQHSESLGVPLSVPEFFLIVAHPIYKMWIIQEPNTLELRNKLLFKEEKTESIYHV